VRLTFSTPGTSTAWMPASPCVSRLQGSSSSVTAGTGQKYELRKASMSGIHLARKVMPRIQSFVEYTFTNLPATICKETWPLGGRNGVFFREEAFVTALFGAHNRIHKGGSNAQIHRTFLADSHISP
jgi:hypothetical protein